MVDVNTAAVSPLLPKPDFVTIGSAQGGINQQALGVAQNTAATEASDLAVSSGNLAAANKTLLQKQQELQAKQAEAIRLAGEKSSREAQVTSLSSALQSAQQDLENRRQAAQQVVVPSTPPPAAPPPSTPPAQPPVQPVQNPIQAALSSSRSNELLTGSAGQWYNDMRGYEDQIATANRYISEIQSGQRSGGSKTIARLEAEIQQYRIKYQQAKDQVEMYARNLM